jgi:NADH-quinone oxidoreductase subunit L
VPAREAPPEHGFERVLENKYYVDEAYDRAIVRPLVGGSRVILWKGIDRGIIDSMFVNGSAALSRGVGWVGSQLQSGEAGAYAWAIAIGALAVIGAFTLR